MPHSFDSFWFSGTNFSQIPYACNTIGRTRSHQISIFPAKIYGVDPLVMQGPGIGNFPSFLIPRLQFTRTLAKVYGLGIVRLMGYTEDGLLGGIQHIKQILLRVHRSDEAIVAAGKNLHT